MTFGYLIPVYCLHVETSKERIQLDVSLEKTDMWLQESLRMPFCCFVLIEVWRETGVIQGWSFSVEKT